MFGGMYCLRRQVTAAVVDDNGRLVSIVDSHGQRINTKYLVMDASYASSEIIEPSANVSRISRAVLITDESVLHDKQRHITLLNIPLPGTSSVSVTVYELSSDSLTCPDGLYIVHMTCRSVADDAQSDLKPVTDLLFNTSDSDVSGRPRVLWSLYFNIDNTSQRDLTSVDNILVVGGPDELIDYDNAIAQARQVFDKMCPGEEFLPKAPNPEDIIYDDGETIGEQEAGFELQADSATTTTTTSDSTATADTKTISNIVTTADSATTSDCATTADTISTSDCTTTADIATTADSATTSDRDIGTTEGSSHAGTDNATDSQQDCEVSASSTTLTVINEDSQTQHLSNH